MGQFFQVKVEFQRIQTYLFAARKLRDMVGANVLLGEAIRATLVELAINEFGSSSVDLNQFLDASDMLGELDGQDPLSDRALAQDSLDRDNPSRLYEHGILSRDGGHFWAVFSEDHAAAGFATAASNMISENLPGLRFSVSVVDFEAEFAKASSSDQNTITENKASEVDIVSSPLFETCAASDLGFASSVDPASKSPISDGVKKRRDGYNKFRGKDKSEGTRDIVGLLGLQGAKLSEEAVGDDFHTLCGRDYMAVIVADGNDVGKRALAEIDVKQSKTASEDQGSYPKSMKEFVLREAKMERFFQKTRVAMRRATYNALQTVFGEHDQKLLNKYKLLMLGGDDLLMVCPAKAAPSFIVELAREIQKLETESGGLTLGIGIAFSAPNLPFHHVHDTAEAMSASAKRLYRRLRDDKTPCSTVDWNLETGSWTPDPVQRRVEDNLARAETGSVICTNTRPLAVLRQGPNDQNDTDLTCFDVMSKASEALGAKVEGSADSKALSRSKLLAFSNGLVRGKEWSTYQLETSSPGFKNALKDACGLEPKNLWQEASADFHVTPFRDIIELLEIGQIDMRRDEPGGSE